MKKASNNFLQRNDGFWPFLEIWLLSPCIQLMCIQQMLGIDHVHKSKTGLGNLLQTDNFHGTDVLLNRYITEVRIDMRREKNNRQVF